MPTMFSKKIKKFLKLPYFSDLVEENVKHRCVFPSGDFFHRHYSGVCSSLSCFKCKKL